MALHEKKVPFSSREVQIQRGEQYEPWFLQINPKGEVPVLQDGVRIIPDSSRIIDYIEDNFSNGNKPYLVPRHLGPAVKQKVDYFRSYLDQLPAGVITMGSFFHPDVCGERRFPFNFPVGVLMKRMEVNSPTVLNQLAQDNPEFAEPLTQKKKLQEQKRQIIEDKVQFQQVLTQVDDVIAMVEDELADHARSDATKDWWLCCESFTVADISLCVLLERLRNVGLSRQFWSAEQRPHITRYLARAEKRESFMKTMTTPTCVKTFYHSCPFVIGGIVLLVAISLAGIFLSRRSCLRRCPSLRRSWTTYSMPQTFRKVMDTKGM